MVYGTDNRAAKQWKTNQRSQCPVTVDQIEASARRMTGGALQSYDYQSRQRNHNEWMEGIRNN